MFLFLNSWLDGDVNFYKFLHLDFLRNYGFCKMFVKFCFFNGTPSSGIERYGIFSLVHRHVKR